MHKGPSQASLFFLALAVAVASLSMPKAEAQVYRLAGLVRPALVGLATWQPAIDFASLVGMVGLADFVIKNYKTDASGSLAPIQGASVNTVDLYSGTSTMPAVSVVVDPSAMPVDMPSTWKYDFNSGMTFDPSLNSAPGTPGSTGSGSLIWTWSGSLCGNAQTYSGSSVASVAAQAISYSNGTCPTTPAYSSANINEVTGSWDFVVGNVSHYTQQDTSNGGTAGPASKPAVDPANPPMWASDGKCTAVRVGNTFSGHPQDPDCWLGGNKKNGPSPPPPGVVQTPTSVGASNGQGSSTTVVINPDGSTRITNTVPNGTGSGTVQNIVDLAPPNPAQVGSTYVTGQVQNVFNGTGTQTSSTPAVSTVPVSGSTPGVASGATTGATPGATTDICAANPNIEACQVIAPGDPSPTDGLYTAQTGICATFGCILDSMATKVKASQLWASTVGYFRVSDSAGGCGGLSSTFTVFGRTIDLNIDAIFCGATAQKAYVALSVVLLITVSVAAFSIAIL